MSKKEKTNFKEVKKQNYEAKTMNTSENLKKKKYNDLPWWVELLFVQIGLPDNLLIKILKTKKKAKELIKNEQKLLVIFFFDEYIFLSKSLFNFLLFFAIYKFLFKIQIYNTQIHR